MILTPLQKLPNNAGDLGKIIDATCFEWLPKVQKIAQSGHSGSNLQTSLKVMKRMRFKLRFERFAFLQ